jgi:hypothetical protein
MTGCADVVTGETNGKRSYHVLLWVCWCFCSSKNGGTVVVDVPSVKTVFRDVLHTFH